VSAGRPLDALELADFTAHVGSAFRLRLADGTALELVLQEATAHPHLPPQPGRRRGFSLVLRSALPGHLPQGIYRLEHESTGPMELFLVPIGPRGGGMCYEAVFN
jgi:hypothetical protein